MRRGQISVARGGMFTGAVWVLVALAAVLVAAPVFPAAAAPIAQAAQVTPGDMASGDTFGTTLALSADGATALIGARGKNNYRGAAYLFTKNGGRSWTEAGKLSANDWEVGDYFGATVALSGDSFTALVGAYSANGRRGAVYVFSRGGNGWEQQAKLTIPDGKIGDNFGVAVALSADNSTAAIGASNANQTYGVVYIFTREGGNWSLQAQLVADSPRQRDGLGTALCMSADGNIVVAGATGRNGNAGVAFVFGRNGAQWSQTAQLRTDSGGEGDFFGWSLAMSRDAATVVVGTPNRMGYRGTAYIFARDGTSSWTQQSTLFVSDAAPNDRFGNSVAISGDGAIIIVGAPNKNDQTGTAYLFTRVGGDTTYTQQAKLTANDGRSGDRYGTAVAITADGTAAAVGAGERNNTSGAVYFYI